MMVPDFFQKVQRETLLSSLNVVGFPLVCNKRLRACHLIVLLRWLFLLQEIVKGMSHLRTMSFAFILLEQTQIVRCFATPHISRRWFGLWQLCVNDLVHTQFGSTLSTLRLRDGHSFQLRLADPP